MGETSARRGEVTVLVGYRAKRMRIGAKRGVGIAAATGGLYLTVRFLPPEMWVSLIGLILIWVGWVLFKE
jgi:ammonia channel protein AmtB